MKFLLVYLFISGCLLPNTWALSGCPESVYDAREFQKCLTPFPDGSGSWLGQNALIENYAVDPASYRLMASASNLNPPQISISPAANFYLYYGANYLSAVYSSRSRWHVGYSSH